MAKQMLIPTSTHWGNFDVETRNGRVVAIHPAKHDNVKTATRLVARHIRAFRYRTLLPDAGCAILLGKAIAGRV